MRNRWILFCETGNGILRRDFDMVTHDAYPYYDKIRQTAVIKDRIDA
jgi:hypothetical protein